MSVDHDFEDVLLVGAGFTGLHALWKFRKLGFSVKIYERDDGLGGTWWSNRYPGARVDIETPLYQLPEERDVWETFDWTERFPGRQELQRYFQHLDKVLNLSKDIKFNTCVTSAEFYESKHLWLVKTNTGLETYTRYLILCTGYVSKRYTPTFKCLDKFKGTLIKHSTEWPEEELSVVGKRVAVVGTGASGVQIIEAIGPSVGHLTVYQRTPNTAFPMRQVIMKNGHQDGSNGWEFPPKERYEAIFKNSLNTFAAVIIDRCFTPTKFNAVTPDQRRELYESLWEYGAYAFFMCGFMESAFDETANDELYAFWAEKIRKRINDPRKRDILAPIVKLHPFGARVPTLETSYFEVFNQSNVDIVNLRESPLIQFTESGIETQKEGVIPFDIIILATGFDSITGPILDIEIKNNEGVTLKEKWSRGTKTYLGLSSNGFPNLFLLNGPQAPSSFANGPIFGGLQGNWLAEMLLKMKMGGHTRVENTQQAEEEWTAEVKDAFNKGLISKTENWHQGSNIPGKLQEPLVHFCGIPTYIKKLEASKNENYEGFVFQ